MADGGTATPEPPAEAEVSGGTGSVRTEPKVAIVCDWLTGIGGAERVVLELHNLYPQAPIFTSQYTPSKIDWFSSADVRTGWLQKLPAALKKFLPPLRAWYFSHLNLNEYDVVISSSGAEAKAVKTRPDALHVSYCHSPTHYYWTRYEQYMQQPGFGLLNPLARLGLKLLVGPMKRWDFKAAQRADMLVANSSYTQKNIKKYYRRDSAVIFPPVDTERFAKAAAESHARQGFVVAGRQTPYKRIDLAVVACTAINAPLNVIGNGPDHERLKAMAGPSIQFLTDVSDAEIPAYFAAAEAFIFANADDFGIVAVEAMAAGTPVVAYKEGGALDYVQPGVTGHFFAQQTTEALAEALKKVQAGQWNNLSIRQHAQQYSIEEFHAHVSKFIARSKGAK